MKKVFLSLGILSIGIGISVLILIYPVNADCGGWFEPRCDNASDLQQNEQSRVSENQVKMVKSVPVPLLENSLERINIKKRLELWNNDNKESYIYLISFGKVMAFYVVKGKITSGNKRLTSAERIIESCEGVPNCERYIMESPELDGTYGSSASYVFFWTTDGVYVQWNGEYMLSDQPLKLTTQPELVRNIK